jgi:iron complex outermembrane receptor protein
MQYKIKKFSNNRFGKFTFRHSTIKVALLMALGVHGGVYAEPMLGAVEVRDNREVATLHLDQVSTTGSRTGLTNRELPASIEAVDTKTMQERGSTQLPDAISRTTGLTTVGAPGNGGLAFSSRGFSGVNSVGIAEDGVRVQTASGTQNYPDSTWGYDRIEVIRGPASVVYGSGTVGATINAIRKEPSRVSSQDLMIGVGTDGYKQLGVGSTGALNESTSYRVDAYGFNNDGYRDLGESKGGKLMSKLRIQPSSEFKLDFTADYSLTNPERYFGTPYDSNKKIVESLLNKNYNTSDSIIRYEDTRLKAKADWQALDWLKLSNEVYYLESNRHWKNIENYSLNTTSNTVARSSYLEIFHNLQQTGNRLESHAKLSGHSLVAGWETARIDFRHDNNSPYSGSSTVSASSPVAGAWASSDATLPKFSTASTFNAYYLEDAWKWSDRWVLLAGIRKDYSTISRDDLLTGSKFSTDLVGTSGRLGLTHHLTQDTSVYAQTSQGSDPVDSLVTVSLANSKFRLTKGKQAEAGIKQSIGNGVGEWSAAVFRIKKDDIITRDPNNSALSIQGGSMHSQGVELTGAFAPITNVRVELNYTRLLARYDDFSEAVSGVAVSRAGNRPVNVPEQSANLWTHYRLADWQASLGFRYVGDRYSDNANTSKLDPFTVVDASLAWHMDKKTTLRLFGRNLTDKVYASSAYNTQYFIGAPRRFDLVAELKF